MTEDQFQRYLCDRYEDQTKWLSKKATKYKKLYQSLTALTSVLAISATVVTALDVAKMAVLLITSSVALTTSLLQLFKFKDLWTTYRATEEAMKREFSYFRAGLHNYGNLEDDDAKRSVFVDRIETILIHENVNWIQSQNSQGRERQSGTSAGS